MLACCFCVSLSFFFNDPATTEIYTLSLHDALPIYLAEQDMRQATASAGTAIALPRAFIDPRSGAATSVIGPVPLIPGRSEEHTSELQSRLHLVCRLLLVKNKKKKKRTT